MEVKLLESTPDQLRLMYLVRGMIRGNLEEPEEKNNSIEAYHDIMKTEIRTHLEFVDFTFAISGVTRAFTHQLVRHRHASFMQESLRFSVKTGEQFEFLLPKSIIENGVHIGIGDCKDVKDIYNNCMSNIQESYEELIEAGVPTEDARGLLPQNILTNIIFKANLRTLEQMAEQRLCYQAQSEFRLVMNTMALRVIETEPTFKSIFWPKCVKRGVCDWRGSMDRACPMQEFVNEDIAIRSNKWTKLWSKQLGVEW